MSSSGKGQSRIDRADEIEQAWSYANAGGRVISSTLGPGAIVGQTIFFDANYDFGGTDAGAIQLARQGLPVAHISVPCRYIHSPVSVASKSDFEAAKALLVESLNNMNDFFSNK